MKERPILFSAPMVRALLDGTKTQTRRVIKLPHANPLGQWEATVIGGQDGGRTAAGAIVPEQGAIWHTRTGECLSSPYGQPGDRLWVRETWQGPLVDDVDAYRAEPANFQKPEFCEYAADGGEAPEFMTMDDELVCRWRPSIHMPRWASRILLEVVSVRVERLQEISEEDCWAEGIDAVDGALDDLAILDLATRMSRSCHDAAPTYAALWESINGTGSWDANPWVWVVEFKRMAP